jgi:hypothetical protein
VTNRGEGVSVNCEFTFICESDPEADDEDEESDGAGVEAESRGDVGVDVSEVTEEEEIAEAEVILDDEGMVVLLPTDELAADDAADEDEEAPAPAGGNLSSAPLISLWTIQRVKDSQLPSQRKIINIQINIFRILLNIPTILIGDFQSMFRICQARSSEQDSLELTVS